MNIVLKTVGVTFFSTFILASLYQNQLTVKENNKLITSKIEPSIEKGNVENITLNEKIEQTNIRTSQMRLDEFITLQLSKFKPTYAQDENFNFITVSNIQEKPEISEYYRLDYKSATEKLQNVSFYISKNYSVPLPLAEEIVYHTHEKSLNENIDPLLVLSIISVESTFRPQSKSHAGAIGLTQVIPKWHPEKIAKLPAGENLWSIPGNIYVGTSVIKEYLGTSNGNLTLALQKYNGSTHDETRKYSRKVLYKYQTYKRIFNRA